MARAISYVGRHRAPQAAIRSRIAAPTLACAATAGVLFAPGVAHAETVWDRVAYCESTGNWSINTGNGYYGGLQFSARTWIGFGGGKYAAYAHQASKPEQIDTAQEVLKVQGPGAWPTCSVRAGLTVANGLAVDPWADSDEEPPASGDLVVDGVLGAKTYATMEKWLGRPVNGVFSTNDKIALQKRLKVPADGVIGPQTVKALQRLVGAYPDGAWGRRTTMALQTYLNKVL